MITENDSGFRLFATHPRILSYNKKIINELLSPQGVAVSSFRRAVISYLLLIDLKELVGDELILERNGVVIITNILNINRNVITEGSLMLEVRPGAIRKQGYRYSVVREKPLGPRNHGSGGMQKLPILNQRSRHERVPLGRRRKRVLIPPYSPPPGYGHGFEPQRQTYARGRGTLAKWDRRNPRFAWVYAATMVNMTSPYDSCVVALSGGNNLLQLYHLIRPQVTASSAKPSRAVVIRNGASLIKNTAVAIDKSGEGHWLVTE